MEANQQYVLLHLYLGTAASHPIRVRLGLRCLILLETSVTNLHQQQLY